MAFKNLKSWSFERMKSRPFEEVKKRYDRNIRWDLNTQKRTKLKVLGKKARSTLLCASVATTHAGRLQRQFLSRWGRLSIQQRQNRLRFWTVLDCVVPLEEETILAVVPGFRERLNAVCDAAKGIEVIGVFEIEVLNISKMRQLAVGDDEARKLDVVTDLMPDSEKFLFKESKDSWALVHFHGVVDLGMNAAEKHTLLSEKARRFWDKRYQVELKAFHTNKPIETSLTNIAKYLVKGGNENLIYKIGFGWDDAEDLERKMLKAGKDQLGGDFEGFTNEMSLTREEVRILGNTIDRLMDSSGSKYMKNGYLFRYGQQVKWIA